MNDIKQHSIADIIKDTLAKFNIGKQGSILVLLPNTPEEDIILISRDAGLTVSMYKKPKCKAGWNLSESYQPIMITTNNILNETPVNFELKKDTAIATFRDGTTVTVSINKEPSAATIEEASRALIAIPDKMDVSMEVTTLATHGQTESISAYGGRVLVGNQHIMVRYESKKTGELKIVNRDVMTMVKSLGKNSGGLVHLTSTEKNMVVSTNANKSTEASDTAQVYMICSNYSSKSSMTAQQTVEGTEAMINKSGSIIVKSAAGIPGLMDAMKSVIEKYAGGTSAFLNLSFTKEKVTIHIKDVQTEVVREMDITGADVQLDDTQEYPYVIMFTVSVARYLMDLSDNITEIKTYVQGKRNVIVLTTDKESVIFAL